MQDERCVNNDRAAAMPHDMQRHNHTTTINGINPACMKMSSNSGKKRPLPLVAEASDVATPPSRHALMDSLPYVDAVYEDYEQYALALIEEEMKSSKPPTDLEGIRPIQFHTPLMKKEYQRIESDVAASENGKPTPVSMEVLTSTATAPSDNGNVDAWRLAVRQARAEYEYERARSIGLEAKKDPGAALLWQAFNGSLDQDLQATQKALAKEQEVVEQVNLQRSNEQQKAGTQIHILTTQYQSALERRFQLQHATSALEKEVAQLSSSE